MGVLHLERNCVRLYRLRQEKQIMDTIFWRLGDDGDFVDDACPPHVIGKYRNHADNLVAPATRLLENFRSFKTTSL
jgi:hypothetical protein